MIGVFSISNMEETTNRVIEWIHHFGGDYVRFNGQEISELTLVLRENDPRAMSYLQKGDLQIPTRDIGAVWYRRTSVPNLPQFQDLEEGPLYLQMNAHMNAEMDAVKNAIYASLEHAYWLSRPGESSPNKLGMLAQARSLGIDVPCTLITNDREELLDFEDRVGDIIVKPVGDMRIFSSGNHLAGQFTSIVNRKEIEAYPSHFFPIQAQQCIEKQYEIRTFFLEGVCYSMAILSQQDKQTQLDFRVYNYEKPNRTLPYNIGPDMEEKVRHLMKAYNLDTGSIDFMVGLDGKHYFLEINPVGQFGMTSIPCNYQLEKRVAQLLIEKDHLYCESRAI